MRTPVICNGCRVQTKRYGPGFAVSNVSEAWAGPGMTGVRHASDPDGV